MYLVHARPLFFFLDVDSPPNRLGAELANEYDKLKISLRRTETA